MLAFGLLKSYGMLLVELLKVYDGGAGTTAMVGSVTSLVMSFIGLFGCTLGEMTTFRKVLLVGGIFQSSGLFFSVFVNRLPVMFLTYTLITGMGYGLLISPCATVLNFYFEKRRALASGLLNSASGVGMFIFQYLYRSLFDEYGLEGCLLIISGIVLNNCVAGSLIRQPQQLKGPNVSLTMTSDRIPPINTFTKFLRKVFKTRFTLFRNLSFALECASLALAQIGYASHFFLYPAFVKSRGFDDTSAVLAMVILSSVEVICKIMMGGLADYISPAILHSTVMFVGGVAAVVVTFTKKLWLLYAYAAITGALPGTFFVFMPPILVRSCGLKNLGASLSTAIVMGALLVAVCVPGLGLMADLTANWNLSFQVIGAIFFTSGLLMVAAEAKTSRKI
ncbi:monocarboxylate transporter 12-like [Saccostrea echinata]|uniref:monocarboxylate transporter 12-like n=1 Tax=Saccostrea echinata TaxID=191078 RepID=UPI002A837B9D|nr:monocarboxylate transporter 12-like [Saccostrea echinata]